MHMTEKAKTLHPGKIFKLHAVHAEVQALLLVPLRFCQGSMQDPCVAQCPHAYYNRLCLELNAGHVDSGYMEMATMFSNLKATTTTRT